MAKSNLYDPQRAAEQSDLPPPMSSKAKWATSSAIWWCNFSFGICMNFLASSLLEFSVSFGTDVATVSRGFTVLTCSYLVGALVFSVAFSYVNRQLSFVAIVASIGLATIALPLVPSLILYYVAAGVIGFSGAGLDTAQIAWIIEIWERDGPAPYIQALNFIYALGTFVSPLIVKPFLSDTDKKKNEGIVHDLRLVSNADSKSPEVYAYLTDNESETGATSASTVSYIPFLIGGLVAIAGATSLLVMYCIDPYVYVKPAKPGDSSQASASECSEQPKPSRTARGLLKSCKTKKALLVSIAAFLMGTYHAMEMCTIQFLPSFTHFVSLGLSQRDGALVLSGLTGAITLGRAAGIVITLRLLPEILLVANLVLIVIGNSVLYLFGDSSLVALWAGSICLGLGFSTVFPCLYGYVGRYVRISNFISGCLIVGGLSVSSLFPLIIGSWIETNPFVLLYTNYFSTSVCVVTFGLIYAITQRGEAIDKGQGKRNGESDTIAAPVPDGNENPECLKGICLPVNSKPSQS